MRSSPAAAKLSWACRCEWSASAAQCRYTWVLTRAPQGIARSAVEPLSVREVNVSDAPDILPWYVWAGVGPFAMLAATATYLHAHWSQIPDHFPVHWGLDGQPDRWSTRSTLGIYGPLFFAAELCAWMLISGLATWFGARRSRLRRVALGSLILCEYLTASLVAAVTLKPLVNVPV